MRNTSIIVRTPNNPSRQPHRRAFEPRPSAGVMQGLALLSLAIDISHLAMDNSFHD